MTRIVPGNAPAKTGAHVIDAENIDQKGPELMRARGQCLCPRAPAFIIGKQLAEVMHHCRAGTGRTHDRIGFRLFEDFDEAPRQPAGLSPVARIKGRLAAASLALIEFDFAAGAPQNLDRTGADRRPQLIDETGDE